MFVHAFEFVFIHYASAFDFVFIFAFVFVFVYVLTFAFVFDTISVFDCFWFQLLIAVYIFSYPLHGIKTFSPVHTKPSRPVRYICFFPHDTRIRLYAHDSMQIRYDLYSYTSGYPPIQ